MANKEPRDGAGLARLAEDIGWKIKIHNSQATIYPPEPAKPVVLGLRMHDWRAFENAKSRLRRAGLFDAAVAHELEHVTATRRALHRDRATADARIEEINTQAAAAAAEGAAPMARRVAELHQLVQRCEAVGWKVRSVGSDGSHVIVTPPTGKPITIATGSSMRSYPATVLSKLTKAGLLEAEDKMRVDNEERRQRLLRNDRAKAEARTPQDEPAEQPEGEGTASATPPAHGVTGQPGDVPGGITEVGGVPVAEWGYASTPVGAVDRKATELLLEDSTIVYGCHLGDFTGKTWQAVSKHRRAEHPKELGRDATKRRAAAAAAVAGEPAESRPEPVETADPPTPAAASPVISLPPVPLFENPPPSPAPGVLFRPAGHAEARAFAEVLDRGEPATPPARVPPAAAVEPRRAEPVPPTVRAGISTVAAASPKPAAAPVSPAPSGSEMNLATMVTRMRQLAGVEADLARLKAENQQLRSDLDVAQRQGASLAEQCVLKDTEIKRLRARAAADAATVATAQELQKLMSSLMGGGATQLAA